MSNEQKTPEENPNLTKESSTGSTPPKKKNPFIENFTNKLSKAVNALAQEEKDMHAFSEAGVDLKKMNPTAIKNIGKDLKGKFDKKTESKPSEGKPEATKTTEKKSDTLDQDK